MSGDELMNIMARGIADAQGDAYAEYSSEFDAYAEAALAALKKHSAGLSMDGVNVWGSPDSIKAVMTWQHSHATVDGLRTNLRHWRDECGKVHAHKAELLGTLKRVAMVLEDGSMNPSDEAFIRLLDIVMPVLIALGDPK